MTRCALIGRRGSQFLQIQTLVRSEDSTSTCDTVVSECECLRMNVDDIGTQGLEEQIGFMSDLLLIDKDDRCSHRHGGPDSDVNAVNCYLVTVLLF